MNEGTYIVNDFVQNTFVFHIIFIGMTIRWRTPRISVCLFVVRIGDLKKQRFPVSERCKRM